MEEQERVYKLVHKFLKLNKISVDQEKLKLELYGNPDYPKLGSVMSALFNLEIRYSAYETDNKESDFENLPAFFLALVLDYRGAYRIALIEKRQTEIVVEFEKKIKQIISEEVFIKFWSGIVITIEEEGSSLSYHYRSIVKKENILFFLLSFAAIAIHLSYKPSWLTSIYFILCLSGFFIGILIFMVDINVASKLTEKICGKSNTRFNCTDLIRSKEALIFKSFKLGDAVMVYFSILVISYLLFGNTPDDLQAISLVFGILSLPAIVYSLLLQWKTSRSCVLCLAVIMILVLQLAVAVFFPFRNLLPSTDLILKVMLLSAIILALWKVIRTTIEKHTSGFLLQVKYMKLKKDFKVFEFLLYQNPRIATTIENNDEIIFGNKDATLELIFVTNPNCQFCKMAYEPIYNIIENYGQHVRVVFRVGSLEKNVSELRIANQLLEIYHKEGEKQCYDTFKKLFHKNSNAIFDEPCVNADLSYKSVLQMQEQWLKANALDFVPALIINQHLYPTEHYEIHDLSFFIDNLI